MTPATAVELLRVSFARRRGCGWTPGEADARATRAGRAGERAAQEFLYQLSKRVDEEALRRSVAALPRETRSKVGEDVVRAVAWSVPTSTEEMVDVLDAEWGMHDADELPSRLWNGLSPVEADMLLDIVTKNREAKASAVKAEKEARDKKKAAA